MQTWRGCLIEQRLDSHCRGTGTEDTQVGEGLALLLCKGKTNMGSAAITVDSGRQISVPLGHCLQIWQLVRDLFLCMGRQIGVEG